MTAERRPIQFNLRALLAALPLLGVLPMLAFSLALLQQQWDAHQQEIQRDLQQTVQTLAVAVQRQINASSRQLQLVAAMPTLEPDSLPEFHRYMRQLAGERGEWDNMVLTQPGGREILNAAMELGSPLPEPDPLDYPAILTSAEPVVSDVYPSNLDGEPSISISTVLRRGSGIEWVLSAHLSRQHLADLLHEPLREAPFLSSVVDRQGRIVSRNRNFDRLFGTMASSDYLALIRGASNGLSVSQTADGRRVLTSWQRLDNGWTVGVGVDPTALEAPLRQTLLIAALAGLVLLGLGLIAASLLSRRIIRAIDTAAEDAHAMAQAQPVQARQSLIYQVNKLFHAHQEASRRLTLAAQQRNEAMQRMMGEVRRRDEFLSMLAHELRNPLAPMVNAVWMLERSPRLDTQDARRLKVLADQIRQLTRLVDDLLDASRLVNGKITLQLQPVSMLLLAQQAVDAMQPLVEASGQQLRLEASSDPAMILADPERISQVLHNLLGNGIKFGKPGGLLRLRLEATPDEAVVSVIDDGTGIDPARLGELFQPFAQIDPGMDRSKGGLGLGLTISRQLAQMHGGSLDAYSTGLGQGATFTLRLPRQAALPDASAQPAAPAALARPAL